MIVLLGTPSRYADTISGATNADDSFENPLSPEPNSISAPAYKSTLPPASLTESIFADGTDVPLPGKTINPANVWANFGFTTAERYRPGGVLASRQGWPAALAFATGKSGMSRIFTYFGTERLRNTLACLMLTQHKAHTQPRQISAGLCILGTNIW